MRTIKIDQSISSKLEEHSDQRKSAQVGLVIGSIGDDTRDCVLAVIPTPSFEDGQQAIEVSGTSVDTSKKGKGAKFSQEPQVQIKADWVIEHASQVAPLIPGGVAIAGLFVHCPEACFSAATAQLCRVLLSLRSSGVIMGDAVLLTVAATSCKLGVKELPASASSMAALKSCDCRAAPVLSSYIGVRTMYSLGAACTVTSTGEQLQDPLRRTVQAEKDSIAAAAVCLEASRIPEAATPVADLCTQGTVAIQAQLLTPPACCLGSGQQGDVAHGRTALSGAVAGRALVHKRDGWSAAATALKADLHRSLEARLNVVLTDAEVAVAGEDEEAQNALLQPGAAAYGSLQSCCLPQRVYFAAEGPMVFSDYCLYGRDAAQALSTAHEVLGLDIITEDQLEWPEQVAAQQRPGSWDPLAVQAKPTEEELGKAPAAATSVPLNDQVCMMLGVGVAGAAAVAAGFAWLYLGS